MTDLPKTDGIDVLSKWERGIQVYMVWTPYVSLAVSLLIASLIEWDAVTFGIAIAAAAWTWGTFTRMGAPSEVPQGPLRVYFLGFALLALILVSRQTVFFVYGITGFFHAALLRPWWAMFVGIGITGFVVHSHIVFLDQRLSAWLIYLGIVAVQTVSVAGGIYGGAKVGETAEERRQTVAKLEAAMAENAGLHAQLVAQAHEAGVLDERQRMAREIHDTIAQGLTGVITQIEAAEQSWGDEAELKRHLDLASGIARESLEEARRSVQAIRPGPLDHSRLPEALSEVAKRWSETTGVSTTVHTTGEPLPLRPEVEVTLLRAAQESLANTAKHAQAGRAALTLSFMGRAVALDVRDDGVGFDVDTPPEDGHFGLAAMRQRVEDVNGTMEVESAPGEGTAIAITITIEGVPDE
ncbi:MAG: sensor histidine kinase [Acidimicrobiia bacterium]|nr:sensor histidine kinase [Acidimicrobiia bacterium]